MIITKIKKISTFKNLKNFQKNFMKMKIKKLNLQFANQKMNLRKLWEENCNR